MRFAKKKMSYKSPNQSLTYNIIVGNFETIILKVQLRFSKESLVLKREVLV